MNKIMVFVLYAVLGIKIYELGCLVRDMFEVQDFVAQRVIHLQASVAMLYIIGACYLLYRRRDL